MTGRIIPHVQITDSFGEVKKTPEFYRFPLTGVLLMATTMRVDQKCTLKVTFTDSKGNPAEVDKPPVWLTNNTDVLALSPSEDGMECEIVPVGVPGIADVQMSADADLGDGEELLTGREAFNIEAGQATNVKVEVGPVQDQTSPTVPGGGTGPVDPDFGIEEGRPLRPGNRPPGSIPDRPVDPGFGIPEKPPGIGLPKPPGGIKPPDTGSGGKPPRPDAGLPGGGAEPKKK